MRKQILEALKYDFQKINKVNGFNNDIKLVTTKALSLGDINYSNNPAVEIFTLGTNITNYENIREYEWELGILVYIIVDAVHSETNFIEERVENMIEDIEKLIYDTDLSIYNIEGVQKAYISDILPYASDEDAKAVIFLKLTIVYIR